MSKHLQCTRHCLRHLSYTTATKKSFSSSFHQYKKWSSSKLICQDHMTRDWKTRTFLQNMCLCSYHIPSWKHRPLNCLRESRDPFLSHDSCLFVPQSFLLIRAFGNIKAQQSWVLLTLHSNTQAANRPSTWITLIFCNIFMAGNYACAVHINPGSNLPSYFMWILHIFLRIPVGSLLKVVSYHGNEATVVQNTFP